MFTKYQRFILDRPLQQGGKGKRLGIWRFTVRGMAHSGGQPFLYFPLTKKCVLLHSFLTDQK